MMGGAMQIFSLTTANYLVVPPIKGKGQIGLQYGAGKLFSGTKQTFQNKKTFHQVCKAQYYNKIR